jgi:agmatinase
MNRATTTEKTKALTEPPRKPYQTFLNFPLATGLDNLKADVAILGLPYGAPYRMSEVTNDQSNAPTAVRQASARISQALDRHDFDFDGPLFAGKDIHVVDCGDVVADPWDMKAHYRNAEAAARKILPQVKMLLSIGGDHGVPIPIFRALEVVGPVTMVHVDAHLDWRDEVEGVKEGYSNPFRRASEMKWIEAMFQIGLRGQGSARPSDIKDAKTYGSQLFTSFDVLEQGIESVLKRIPDGRKYYLSIDADGVDPSVMPAVMAPSPGGLLYHHMRALIHGLVKKGRLVGMDVVEISPKYDVNDLTSIAAGRVFMNAIGGSAKAGHLG